MNTKALRQKILDLAIHGKLVPQDPNDEPASVLLERIKAEKERLIKEGKIKRTKRSKAACDKPHYPFELPEGWEWCKLEDYVSSVTDGDHQAPPKVSNGVPFLVISNVASEFIDFANTRYVPQDYYDAIQFDRKPERGDILFTVTGSYGIVVKVNTDKQFCFQRHIGLIKPIIDNDYLVYALRSQYVKKLCDDLSTGTAQKTVGLDTLRSFLIPIPPLQEQKRIVESIEHCLLFVNCIEENKGNLQDTIKQTKSKILDLAIHGKLVPQDPKNEPATELLKRINPNAKITCDNPQYENLPNGWCECTLGSLFLFIRNGINIRQDKSKIGYPITRIETISSEFIDRSRMGYAAITEENYSDYYLQKDDILMSHINSPIHVGKCALCDIKAGEKIIHGMNLLCLRPYPDIEAKFILMVFRSPYFKNEIRPFIKNAVNQASINIRNLSSVHLYLPPVSEQNRIVAKIEELFTQLDKIEVSL